MTGADQQKMHRRLLEMRAELLDEIRGKNTEAAALIDEGVADYGDRALTDSLKEYLHLLSDSRRDTLVRIDEALDRMAAGTYGICTDCGCGIDPQRLAVEPQTRFCIDCRREREARESLRSEAGEGKL